MSRAGPDGLPPPLKDPTWTATPPVPPPLPGQSDHQFDSSHPASNSGPLPTSTTATGAPLPPPIAVVTPADTEPTAQPTQPVNVVQQPDAVDDTYLIGTIRAAPPWMLSSVIHMLLIIVLALIPYLTAESEPLIELLVSQTRTNSPSNDFELFSEEVALDRDQVVQIVQDDLTVVDDPLSAPATPPIESADLMASLDLPAPSIGMLLTGREAGMKDALLAAHGGSKETEASVMAGLKWLQAHQDSDGLWSLSGRSRDRIRARTATYSDGSNFENKTVATGLALLAFQGFGQTHLGGPSESFQKSVQKGWTALEKRQVKDGGFTRFIRSDQRHLRTQHLIYTQAICTFAMCELYAMTNDERFRKPAQKAVDYLVDNQHSSGGWRYQSSSGSDLSVTGWVMMALQSARMAGLNVPHETFYKIEKLLDKLGARGGRQYRYNQFREKPTFAMTAEGLLCRQYLGWKHDDKRLMDGAEILANESFNYDAYHDVYYWYYATQVLHNMEGSLWRRWNGVMSAQLPARQESEGPEIGSWSPKGDAWGSLGGRLYTTCLSIYMLEIYYRHLPIYSQNFDLAIPRPAAEAE